MIRESDWPGRVLTAYRPDAVVDPEFEGFAANVAKLGEITGCETATWAGYLDAHRQRRAFFKDHGATSSDHGHATARTEDLAPDAAAALFAKALQGRCTADEADAFRGQMLTEMARMSLEDGMVLQIHPGSWRNHSAPVQSIHGRDKGFDIPSRTEFVRALKPLLDSMGMRADLTIILFMLDESTLARELAPLAGAYPAVRLGPPWWFFDSPEGMRRFRELTTETAGFYNTVGFNDDTRAFCSIPARHDMARRVDCAYLATLVATGRLAEDEAPEVAHDLAYRLAKQAYRL
jgi:glucuronate isomerase